MKELLQEFDNTVNYKDLEQKKSVFYCDSYSFSELIDIKPMPNSNYIYSLCEPFSDAMELDWERYMNWIKHFKLKFYQAHASGHCSKEELKELIKDINASKVIPIHTNDAVIFREFTDKIELVKVGEKVKV
jgi:ribonuclease J